MSFHDMACDYIRKYMVMPDDDIHLAAGYAQATYVFDRYGKFLPLAICGAKGTGRTRLAQLLMNICYSPIKVSQHGAMQPKLREYKGTLFLEGGNLIWSGFWGPKVIISPGLYNPAKEYCLITLQHVDYLGKVPLIIDDYDLQQDARETAEIFAWFRKEVLAGRYNVPATFDDLIKEFLP